MPVHACLLKGAPSDRARRLTKEDLPELRAYVALADALSAGAGDEAIVAYITRLRTHYPPSPELSETLSMLRWEDWFNDLAAWPLDVLVDACDAWRRSPARWAPTSGQLRDAVGTDPAQMAHSRRWLAEIARSAIAELEAREA